MKFLIFAISLMSLTSFAQDSKADGIVKDLSSKIKADKSFYIEFSAKITNSASGLDETETGKGWVKDNKYHASYGENTIISNGLKTWTIVKEEKTVYVMDAEDDDEESMNPKKLMTMWESGFKSKYVKETSFGGTQVHVINLYPKKPGDVEYHTITLYISTSNELKKAVMKTKDGTTMSYTLSKYQANPSVSDSKFAYDASKYPGYKKVED